MTQDPAVGTPGQPQSASPADHTYVVAVAPGDKLYDLLRRDRDTALAQVEALQHEVAGLRAEGPPAKAPAMAEPSPEHAAEIERLRQTNATLTHENETLKSRLHGGSAAQDGIAAKLEAEKQRTSELQAALDEAREALETTSAWGHELHEEAARLREQRGLAHKAVSRYRWEKEKRAPSAETDAPTGAEPSNS